MKPYVYTGEFAPDLRSHVLKNAAHFQQSMKTSIEAFGGRLIRCMLMAQTGDPIGFLEFPDDVTARAWNMFYGGQDGMLGATINRLLDDEDLQKAQSLLDDCGPKAAPHRAS